MLRLHSTDPFRQQPNVIKVLCLLLGPDFYTDIITIETADRASLQLQPSYNWHEAERLEQEAKGCLERQKIMDEAKPGKELLELQAHSDISAINLYNALKRNPLVKQRQRLSHVLRQLRLKERQLLNKPN